MTLQARIVNARFTAVTLKTLKTIFFNCGFYKK